MNTREPWHRMLFTVGGLAMLVGAIDPMEGSLVILPGSGLMVLGAFLRRSDRRLILFRVWVFVLIAVGVGALWGLSIVGGIGGSTGRSAWWGVLIMPYAIGWSMGIWGPGSPRWMLWLGIGVGLWYQAIMAIALWKTSTRPDVSVSAWPSIVLAVIGLLTIVGCISRLSRTESE